MSLKAGRSLGRLHSRAGEDQAIRVAVDVKRLPIQDLELHEVHVNRMSITCGVDDPPDFNRPARFRSPDLPRRIDQSND
jgi:hypothetical protein